MEFLIELPATLGEGLTIEAGRVGVSASEQAAFLLQLATALTREGRKTRFGGVVKAYLRQNSLDADRLSEVIEGLTAFCLKADDSPSTAPKAENHLRFDQPDAAAILKDWRSSEANRSIGDDRSVSVHELPHPEQLVQKAGRAPRIPALGKYAHLSLGTEEFIAEKRLEMEREDRPR